jgi:predicted DNA-binding ribbon-helix-helix protein
MSARLRAAMDRAGPLQSRNVRVGDRLTSMRLEPVMWGALEAVAKAERISVNRLVTLIAGHDGRPNSLTSAVRSAMVAYFMGAA